MAREAINELKKYVLGKTNSISLLQIDQIIKALEQEPCEDAINREEVLKLQYRIDDSATLSTRDVVNVEDIKALSSVAPKEKTGYWIFVDEAHEHAFCSNCDCGDVDLMDGKPHNYCQNCEAKMQVESEEKEHVSSRDNSESSDDG